MNYFTVIVRFWEERDPPWIRSGEWRFCIDNPKTGERRAFRSLNELSRFIHGELDGGTFLNATQDQSHADS